MVVVAGPGPAAASAECCVQACRMRVHRRLTVRLSQNERRHGHGSESLSDAQRMAALVDRRAVLERRHHRDFSACALRVVSFCLVLCIVICAWKGATTTDW